MRLAFGDLVLSSRGFLLDKEVVDVFLGTTVGNDGVAQELVEFRILLDGHEDASRHNSGLLEGLGAVSREFEDFSSQVFEDSGEVNWSSSSDSFGVSSLLEESSDSTNWEVETGLAASAGLLGAFCLSFSLSFSSDSHFYLILSRAGSQFKLTPLSQISALDQSNCRLRGLKRAFLKERIIRL